MWYRFFHLVWQAILWGISIRDSWLNIVNCFLAFSTVLIYFLILAYCCRNLFLLLNALQVSVGQSWCTIGCRRNEIGWKLVSIWLTIDFTIILTILKHHLLIRLFLGLQAIVGAFDPTYFNFSFLLIRDCFLADDLMWKSWFLERDNGMWRRSR